MSSKEQTEQHVGQKRSAQAAETQNYDIAIIGGGVVGGMIPSGEVSQSCRNPGEGA